MLAKTESAANPLPVSLASFAAERRPDGVQVRWSTGTETNSAHFEVQRSADGRSFATVATVEGQGQSTQLRHYTALDRQPLPGLSYYRLRQVDVDGTASLSPVVAVAGNKELALFPNPTAGLVSIRLPEASSGPAPRVRVTDLAGRTVQTQLLPSSGEIDLSALHAGTYLVTVGEGSRQITRRLVKY